MWELYRDYQRRHLAEDYPSLESVCEGRPFFSVFRPLTGGSFTSAHCWRVTARLAALSEEILRAVDPSQHFVSHQGQI